MLFHSVECTKCSKSFSATRILTVCDNCGGALFYRYNLALVSEKVSKSDLKERENSFWKFVEVLPFSSPKRIVSLGEFYTPVIPFSKSIELPLDDVYVKDDGRLPTGTFKARGMAVAVSVLKERGVKSIAIPSAGNAAAALTAYGTKANMNVYTFMPKDVPENILKECVFGGASVFLVDGVISDAAEIAQTLGEKQGWFDISTNKQPYRFEGYKAIAFELAEQFDWSLPDVILFPTGGGEGVIGLWKGFKELLDLGWIDRIPRLVVVQSSGCAPIVEAFERESGEVKEAWKDPETIAAGLRVPKPYASYLIMRAIEETNGLAVAVDDGAILSSMKMFLHRGIYAGPEASSTLAALRKLVDQSLLKRDDKTLLYITGTAMKSLDLLEVEKNKMSVLGSGSA
ncbi:MAG: threonine synthase [Candidatus Bathyarchaeota archaeon]|nr:threonine synthase [Candidatus Bathyarchaeota archaeon]